VRYLTAADYVRQPWANGRGTTIEMLREDGPAGLQLRLSIASVVEDGPFSIFPGIERNLTVISGPGFRLEGDVARDCLPLLPVAFPGDVAVRAAGTGGVPSQDFNVMTARALPLPEVTVLRGGGMLTTGGRLFLLALGPVVVNGQTAGLHNLIFPDGAVEIEGNAPVIAVRLFA
jgi:environmental stress-induced protein Ves